MIDVKKVEDFEKLTTSLNSIATAIENMPTPTGGGIDYTTEEQDTGLKWIDGRTIYQKTITKSFSTTNSLYNCYYGNVDYTNDFDITDWANTYMNAILDKSFITLIDGTVRNIWYIDYQNVPDIAFMFPFTNRSGQLTVTFQYVKGDDLT